MNPIVSFIKRQQLVSFFAISYICTGLGNADVSERIAGAEGTLLIYLDLTQSRSKS